MYFHCNDNSREGKGASAGTVAQRYPKSVGTSRRFQSTGTYTAPPVYVEHSPEGANNNRSAAKGQQVFSRNGGGLATAVLVGVA